MKVTKCNDCPFLSTWVDGKGGLSTPMTTSGGRLTVSCNLQLNGGSYYNKNGNYDSLFEGCPLKKQSITVELNNQP